MARVAYLGPEYSFSHELLKRDFREDEHVAKPSLESVVDCVARGDCAKGVIPFYNTTKLSIEESQIQLLKHKNRVFVTDVLLLEVRHVLASFAKKLSQIVELRSKDVVFHQTSAWVGKNLMRPRQNPFPSTSQAVQSLGVDKDIKLAAIGTLSAARHYGVPILRRDIQNKPNFTLFFVIEQREPELQDSDHILLALKNVTEGQKSAIEDIVTKCDCNISSNWSVQSREISGAAYFFEINGHFSKLGMRTAFGKIRGRYKKAFVVGGYNGKCITHMAWAQNSTKKSTAITNPEAL